MLLVADLPKIDVKLTYVDILENYEHYGIM